MHGHHAHDDHHHHHAHPVRGRKLLWVTLLNFSITIVQVVGGILSNSLSLISDAVHNLPSLSLFWPVSMLKNNLTNGRHSVINVLKFSRRFSMPSC